MMADQSKIMSNTARLLLCLICVGFMNQSSLLSLLLLAVIILDNRGRMPIGDFSEFIVAALFAMFLAIFGTIGGIRTAYFGILVPVGYCVGASFKYKKSSDMITLILLMAISMDVHIILNFLYDLYRYGLSFRAMAIHYDIWSRLVTAATGAMINSTPFLGCVYYLIFKRDWKTRIWCIPLLIINTMYDMIMGGRSFFVILVVAVLIGYFADVLYSNGTSMALRRLFIVGSVITAVIFFGYLILRNTTWFQNFFEITYLFRRFFSENARENILTTGRSNIRQIFVSNMWKYPFGGRQLWGITQQYAHELYMDIYDIGGIVPYVLIIIFVIQTVFTCFRYVKIKTVDTNTKILVISVFACINLHFFVEPILSGAPVLLFLYCVVAGYMSHACKTAHFTAQ